MDQAYEAKYHRLEEHHWWFRARREIVRSLVQSICPTTNSSILEIGCSSGVLIQQLGTVGYRSVTGIDISVEAIRSCNQRGIQNVRVMDAQVLDFAEESFDLITASDVLEHLQDDEAALREWKRALKPGGHAIIFVPAFQFLWSEHDTSNHHFRRYSLSALAEKAARAGFEVLRKSYWNTALMPPIALVRGAKRLAPGRSRGETASSDLFCPPATINGLLYRMLIVENHVLLRGFNLPFGVSAMIIVRRPA